MNKKKTYQTPHSKDIHLIMVQMIATSGITSMSYTNDVVDNDKEALSNDRRGSWENIW